MVQTLWRTVQGTPYSRKQTGPLFAHEQEEKVPKYRSGDIKKTRETGKCNYRSTKKGIAFCPAEVRALILERRA